VPDAPDLRPEAIRRGLPVTGPPEPPDGDGDGTEGDGTGDGSPGWSRRRRLAAASALVALVALVVAAVVVARPDETDDPPGETETEVAAPETPPSTVPPPVTAPPREPDVPVAPPGEPPSEWDPAVLDVVRFVQRERQLDFDRPVEVEMLSDAEYDGRLGGPSGSLGFYDGQRIVVRGTELTPYVQGTVVHELTHALDDQHFDIVNVDPTSSQESQLAHTMLVEGDAVRIEWAYDTMLIANGADPADVLDQASSGAATPGAGGTGPAAGSSPGSGGPGGGGPGTGSPPTTAEPPDPGGTTTTTVGSRSRAPAAPVSPAIPTQPASPAEPYGADIPGLPEAIDQSPYFVGKGLIDVLLATGGNAAVDAAFRDPPRTTEQVLDPRAYLARDEPVPVTQDVPVVPKGDHQEQTTLGALNLYLVLVAGIDPLDALDAATGWGGESAVSYVDGEGRRCVDVAAVGDTEADTAEIGDAFAAWADSGVAAHAATTRRPDGVHVLTACHAGAGVTGGTAEGGSEPFVGLVVAEVRSLQAFVGMRSGGLDPDAGFAFGDCVVHEVPLDSLLAPIDEDGGPSSSVRDDLEDAASAC
jgi:hypothetical protein